MKGVRKGFREAKRAVKQDTKEAQSVLSTLIKDSDLSRENKAKYISAITNADTTAKLEKALPDIQQRVLADIDRQRKAQLKGALQRVVKDNLPKKQSGKPVSKTTPVVTEFVQDINEVLKLTKDQAQEKLDNVDLYENPLLNTVLGLKADIKRVNADDLELMLDNLQDTVAGGRAINKANRLYKLVEAESLRQEVETSIGDQTAVQPGAIKGTVRDAVNTAWLGWNGAWHNKMQHIFTSKDEAATSDLTKRLGLFNESRHYEKNIRQSTEKFTNIVKKKVDMSDRQLLKQWQKDMTEVVDMGHYTDASGKGVRLQMTKAEIRKRLMEFENKEIEEQLYDPDGQAWTLGMKEALEAEVSDFDRAMMESQLEFYSDYYERLNEVYRKIYGINLPRTESYVPIKRDFGDGKSQDEFLQGILYRGGVAPSALKSRQKSRQRIKSQGDIHVMNSHLLEMEYFMAYAEKVNLLNQVFSGDSNRVMNRVEDLYGKKVASIVRQDLDWFANRGVMSSIAGEKFLNQLMRNFGFAQLGAKPQIGLKQLASFSAFSNDVKTTDFIAGLTHFFTHNKEAIALMKESSFIQERGLNLDNDFRELRQDALNGKWINFMGRHPTFTRMMMMPIRYGDKGAILTGGYAHVYAKMKQGASKEEALESMARLATKTQQSADPDMVSSLQRGNPFMRIFGQFMSSANAITRAEMEAFVEFGKGRMTKKEFAKRIAVYHFLIPNTIMFLANGMQWEDEDQLRASVLGSFNGMIILGDMVEFAAGVATGQQNPFDIQGRHPFEFVQSLILAADQFSDLAAGDAIDEMKAMEHLLEGGGSLTGVPMETLYHMLHGVEEVASGDDPAKGAQLLLGYSPYVVEKLK